MNIIFGTVVAPLIETDPSLVWRVVESLDFTEHPPNIEYIHDKVRYEAATPNRLFLRYNSLGSDYHSHWEDGYLTDGAYVLISNGNIRMFTKITALSITGAGNEDYIDVADTVYGHLFTGSDVDTNFDDIHIIAFRLYDYTAATGFETNVGAEVTGGDNFWQFTSIPSGTIENTPDYTHHRVINNIAYALSNEDEEQDIIRYSPEYQPDNLPVLQTITTPIGDIDRNLALIERDGRFCTLKRRSVSQGQFTSSTYYHDKDGVSHGLYATEGYIVIDDVLYFMDNDDIYLFNGVQVLPFLEQSLMRSYYVDNVDENSFFAYNPLDKELWMVLNGVTIVYDFERRNFYLRETDLTPQFAVLDYDKRLFLCGLWSGSGLVATKFVLYNHSQSSYNESIQASFKTGFRDIATPQNYKRLHKALLRVSGSEDITLTASDEKEANYTSASGTPDANKVSLLTFKAKYLFKELEIEVQFDAATNLNGVIKSCDLYVDQWKGIK